VDVTATLDSTRTQANLPEKKFKFSRLATVSHIGCGVSFHVRVLRHLMSTENATSQVIVCCNVLWKHWFGAAARAATSTVGWTREALGSHVAAAASRHQSPDRCIDLSVNVRDKQLSGEGATWLADELRTALVAPAAAWSLASLDLSAQAIGVTGARELSQYLFTSPTLTALTLNACELGDQGIRELCAALDGLVGNRLEFSSRLASLSAVAGRQCAHR
jgi:hypothetical protein